MARFEFAADHAGVTRFSRGLAVIGSFNTIAAALHALALIGSPVTRAAGATRNALAGWSAARKQRAADRKLWDIALSDARVMADLSRAMSREAADIGRYRYY